MRPEAVLADRHAEVRSAARGWRRAGAIDDAALAAVEAAYPDDRVRVGPVFRVLLFLFTFFAVNAGFGLVATLLGWDDLGTWLAGALALATGVALAAATELQMGPLKRSQGGTEAATSFLALCYLLGGGAWLLFEVSDTMGSTILVMLLLCAGLCGAAAWRWGFALYAAFAAVAVLGLLGRLPAGRALWIVASLLAAPLLLRLSESARLAPAHRRSAAAALAVGLAGLYLAVHLGSYDAGLVEWLGAEVETFGWPAPPPGALRPLAIAGTALVPIALLAFGIATRRRLVLLLGLASGLVSLATFFSYVDVVPWWAALVATGMVFVAAVLALRRFLDAGPGQERRGFTAEPLFEDLARQRALEIAGAVVALSPESREAPAEPGFKGGGGEFGGGGASGAF